MSNKLTQLAEPTHFAAGSQACWPSCSSRPTEGGELRRYVVECVVKYEVTWGYTTLDGRAGFQTFVVSAASQAEALGEALREARTERAARHRRWARIQLHGAEVAHLESLL
ncbi:hypothetical protein [Streptomyces sp. NPDC058667]|uniref:hypothetical protein n=1 Tax=Streptomyces sp. NPDC058667 TaxID=3346588 RepID=UPI0036678920